MELSSYNNRLDLFSLYYSQLLAKNKELRLGAVKDFQEIREHPFFEPINWPKLEQREMKPPYNPQVVRYALYFASE